MNQVGIFLYKVLCFLCHPKTLRSLIFLFHAISFICMVVLRVKVDNEILKAPPEYRSEGYVFGYYKTNFWSSTINHAFGSLFGLSLLILRFVQGDGFDESGLTMCGFKWQNRIIEVLIDFSLLCWTGASFSYGANNPCSSTNLYDAPDHYCRGNIFINV